MARTRAGCRKASTHIGQRWFAF